MQFFVKLSRTNLGIEMTIMVPGAILLNVRNAIECRVVSLSVVC